MSTTENQQTNPSTTQGTVSSPISRKKKKAEGRKKKAAKLKTDREFAKAFFEAKSKRSADKKSAYRKKKNKKK